jgi:3-methylfumaryl-CoA hydratase
VLSVQDKQGRSGPLTLVTVGHQTLQAGHLVVDEQQDIVYRSASGPEPASTADAARAPSSSEWSIEVTPALLFRFSALTYNAHRIHYDRDYARDVEGYPGLVTHGPLQAIAMAEAARARGCAGNLFFDYRLVSPLFDHQGLIAQATAEAAETTTAVRDLHGRTTAVGTLRTGEA